MSGVTCGVITCGEEKEASRQFSFKWKIPNFLGRPEKAQKQIWSPYLAVMDMNNREALLRLSLYPNGHDKDSDFISIYLCNESNIALNLKYSLRLENKKREEFNIISCGPFTLRETGHPAGCAGYPKFKGRYTLINNANLLLPEGCLIVLFDVSILVSPSDAAALSVADDFKKVFARKEFSDIRILCHGEEFYCHKIILAARSPVFNAMVTNHFKESIRNEVNLDSMKPEILKEMLMFIYCGRLNNLKNSALELLEAANQYQLNGLMEICGHHLGNNLTKENVLDYLSLADRHNQIYLKEIAMSFIAKNIESLMGTSEWEGLGEKLLVEIMQIIVKERICIKI